MLEAQVRMLTVNVKYFSLYMYIYTFVPPIEPSCNLRTACKRILESSRQTLDDDNSSVYYGKHLIFMRESMFLRLESARKRYRVECVKKIESFWIKYSKYPFAHINVYIFLFLIINFRARENLSKKICNINKIKIQSLLKFCCTVLVKNFQFYFK